MQDEKSLLLRAPKESQNMRTAERGITQSVHKFSFSKVLQLGRLKLCILGTNNMIILHHIFVFIYIYNCLFFHGKIFGPETTQQQFYENTMKKMVNDVLQGENRLLYTYGVTNSGKTYTIQGTDFALGIIIIIIILRRAVQELQFRAVSWRR